MVVLSAVFFSLRKISRAGCYSKVLNRPFFDVNLSFLIFCSVKIKDSLRTRKLFRGIPNSVKAG